MMIISIVCGLLMISGLFVVLCAVLSLMSGSSLYEVGSMLVLAAILLAGSFCLQIVLKKIPSSIDNEKANSLTIRGNHQALDEHGFHFDPWRDEWYGFGPWWKKW